MNIDDVHRGITKNKKPRRVGRGPGSGWGKTAAKGHKGARSRSGYSKISIFQGGTMPLVRRIPKRGFNNKWALEVVALNVSELDKVFDAKAEVTPETLAEKGLVRGAFDQLKILGDGEITKALTVSAHRFSKSAKEKIEAAGGTVVVLPGPKPVEEYKKEKKEESKAKK